MPLVSLLLAAVVASPSPQPSPLKEIVRVRSSAYCTAFRENVAVALAGLRENDKVLDRSKVVFAKMSRDAGNGAATALDFDQIYLERLVDGMVHNFALVDRLLGDASRFPVQPKSEEEQRLGELKSKLNAVADKQRAALNVLSGVLGTEQLNDLMQAGDSAMETALGDTRAQSFYSTPVLSAFASRTPYVEASPAPANARGLFGPAIRAIEENQVDTSVSEALATGAIFDGLLSCGR